MSRKKKEYKIEVTSTCLATYFVMASSKKEALALVENGEVLPLERTDQDDQVVKFVELRKKK